MKTSLQQNWLHYCKAELSALTPLLAQYGFTLSEHQPHLQGERFLQQAVTTESGKKLILYAQNQAGQKVVIKATRNKAGQAELKHERQARQVLADMDFAAEVFHTPPEVAWIETNGFVVSVQAFIDQPRTFLEHTPDEQFDLALKAFKAQEGAHATTYGHLRRIKKTYEIRHAATYLKNFVDFASHVTVLMPEATAVHTHLKEALSELAKNERTIEQYAGFLTHTDFVPHNLRISADETIYLLDHSSLTFGNKYEGWARFLNFMSLYNPPLTELLTQYVLKNRAPEEAESLWLMRLYRLGEIIFYYTKAQAGSEGDLKTLNEARVQFWDTTLKYLLNHEAVPPSVINDYQNKRDALRSPEEKERQKGLH